MSDEMQRILPTSELDLNMMLTNPVWGRPEVSNALRQQLMKQHTQVLPDGKLIVSESSLWDLLDFYKRDLRLANLSEWNNELQTCRYMLDLANDYLNERMGDPFIIALSRAISILETSQSKNGFLRKQMNTLTQRHETRSLEPPKKGFFGVSKDKQQGVY